MARLLARTAVEAAQAEAFLRPRADLVLEREVEPGRFEAVEGPVRDYRRVVDVEPLEDGRCRVTQKVEFSLAVPYVGWLVALPFRRALRRPPSDRPPWWAPPARLDARAARVLGALVAASVVFGYLNTLFTQTATFAGEEFGARSVDEGLAGALVRLGGLLALVVVARADRQGRRRVLLGTAAAGCLLAATGALAPSLAWLTASQAVARAFATALLLLVGIVSAEEMPAGARAYAVSVVAMAGGLGAGGCILALPLADLGDRTWRLIYLVPLVALPLVAHLGRRLPESRRFVAPHAEAGLAGHGGRLWLLAASGFLLNLFVAPNGQFGNHFLRQERDFSGGGIALLSVASGTVAGLGVVVGGRLADVRGRRGVAAVALVGGTLCTVASYFSHGGALWAWVMAGTLIYDASIPALGVYGPELFPTSARGRANGLIAVIALAGSAAGLLAAGALSDRWGSVAPAMGVLALGPVAVAALVLARYPETAGRELEELNPEDRPPAPPPNFSR